MTQKATFLMVLILTGLVLLTQTAFVVPETQQVIVLQFGKPVAQYTEPGLKFKIPFIQNLKVFESRVLDADPPAREWILADQKRLVVDAFARYKISDMLKFYQTLGDEGKAMQNLHNLVNSSVKNTMGNYSLLDVLSTRREKMMAEIKKQAEVSSKDWGLEIIDVRIGRADLPEQTVKNVYEQMRSARVKEAKEFRAQGEELAKKITSTADKDRTVMLAEAEKKSQILRGEGDREAIKIYADAFKKDPEFYGFYRSLEAYRKSMIDQETMLVLSPDSEFFKYFGINGKSNGK